MSCGRLSGTPIRNTRSRHLDVYFTKPCCAVSQRCNMNQSFNEPMLNYNWPVLISSTASHLLLAERKPQCSMRPSFRATSEALNDAFFAECRSSGVAAAQGRAPANEGARDEDDAGHIARIEDLTLGS